ncbi:hypothetical protein PSE_4382 [Pseudovibrio sp. FO-BEG1]|nr:hypothetical protein PSE_4382 [Pseudovibrio sp. FO-BEG1]
MFTGVGLSVLVSPAKFFGVATYGLLIAVLAEIQETLRHRTCDYIWGVIFEKICSLWRNLSRKTSLFALAKPWSAP